jgi:hypothetical protein
MIGNHGRFLNLIFASECSDMLAMFCCLKSFFGSTVHVSMKINVENVMEYLLGEGF